jgi:hypothetical protein
MNNYEVAVRERHYAGSSFNRCGHGSDGDLTRSELRLRLPPAGFVIFGHPTSIIVRLFQSLILLPSLIADG